MTRGTMEFTEIRNDALIKTKGLLILINTANIIAFQCFPYFI